MRLKQKLPNLFDPSMHCWRLNNCYDSVSYTFGVRSLLCDYITLYNSTTYTGYILYRGESIDCASQGQSALH